MVKLLNATKYPFRRHPPPLSKKKSHTPSHCIVEGGVTRVSAIRRHHGLWGNDIPLLLQELEELAHVGRRRRVVRGWALTCWD